MILVKTNALRTKQTFFPMETKDHSKRKTNLKCSLYIYTTLESCNHFFYKHWRSMNIIRSTFTWKSASEKNAKNKLGAGDGGEKTLRECDR